MIEYLIDELEKLNLTEELLRNQGIKSIDVINKDSPKMIVKTLEDTEIIVNGLKNILDYCKKIKNKK